MKNSKLIALLSTFNAEDWRWFSKFIKSPYFNSREELLPFAEYLRKLAPDFKEKQIEKEKVFQKLYPKKKFDEKWLGHLMNYLLKLAERFLAQRKLEEQEPLFNNSLLKSLVERQLSKHYRHYEQKSNKLLEKWRLKNKDAYLYNYQLADIGNNHFMSQNLRQYDPSLQLATDRLDQFYFLNKIKNSCEMLSRMDLVESSYQSHFITEVIDHVSSVENSYPLTLVYAQAYDAIKTGETATFETLRKSLQEHKKEIPATEKEFIYSYAINICNDKMVKNIDAKFYTEQCLELYLEGIEEGFLLDRERLSPWHFKNVVKLAMNLKRYDFTEQFIQENYHKLEPEFQEDALHFNLADLHYQRGNYQKAQEHLLQVEYSDIFYALGARALLLKIYYETQEDEALISLLASFSIYLRRNKKVSSVFREAYLNFTSLLTQINKATKDKIPAIIEKINNTNRVINRRWLLQICEEF